MRLGLGALLLAVGCNQAFVLGDVADSTRGPGEFGGSGGSGGSDDDAVCAVDGSLECSADNALRRCVDGRSRWDTVLECPVGTTCSNDPTLSDPCLIEPPATPVGGEGGTSVGGEGGEGGTSVGAGGGTSTTGDTSTTGVLCECTPGDSSSRQQACGNCGTVTETRVCNEDCRWGPFSDAGVGACTNGGPCAPGISLTVIRHCSNGRWRDRTVACSDTCEWGAWVEGECEGDADACTGCACVSYCTDPDTGGTSCLWIDCSEAEARAECEQEIVDICGTSNDPFTFVEWLPN